MLSETGQGVSPLPHGFWNFPLKLLSLQVARVVWLPHHTEAPSHSPLIVSNQGLCLGLCKGAVHSSLSRCMSVDMQRPGPIPPVPVLLLFIRHYNIPGSDPQVKSPPEFTLSGAARGSLGGSTVPSSGHSLE
jgi:hypothetical protein